MSAISFQSGIREYTGDLSQYTGMLGGLRLLIFILSGVSILRLQTGLSA